MAFAANRGAVRRSRACAYLADVGVRTAAPFIEDGVTC